MTLHAEVHLGFGQVAHRAGQLMVADARGADALLLAEAAGAELLKLRVHLLLARVRYALGRPTEAQDHLGSAATLARELGSPHWQALVWQVGAKFSDDPAALRQKAAAYLRFYLNQLAPLARREFLSWPDRRDAFSARATTSLEALVPTARREALR